jgi:hypothetical protein
MKQIKLSTYFAYKNPKYTCLQLIPSTSNRNYDTELIAQTISSMTQLPILKRLYKEKIQKSFKIYYNMPEKVVFFMKFTKVDCQFYLIVPEHYKTLYISKCTETWRRITVKELQDMPKFCGGIIASLQYSKEDALSLKINKKMNEPLNNLITVKSVMEEDDEINIITNFLPMFQNRWKGVYKTSINKLKTGFPLDKNKFTAMYMMQAGMTGLFALIDMVLGLLNSFISSEQLEDKKTSQIVHDRISQLSQFTIKKEMATVLQTQILIGSKSKDKIRAENNIKTIVESYRVVGQDNSLEQKKVDPKLTSKNIDYLSSSIMNAPKLITSTSECNNFIQLPGRDLIESMHIKTKVDVLECAVPDELVKGDISLGLVEYKDKKQTAYFPTDYNYANLALLILAPQGAGKSNFIANYGKSASKVNESNIFIDYVKNCELSEAVTKVIDKNKLLTIDLSDKRDFQAFAFNEVKYNGTDEFKRFEMASMKAEQTLAFVDALNKDGLRLTGNMRRILNAASNIVYIHNDASVGDVISCLERHTVRTNYINYIKQNISEEGKNYLSDMTEALAEIDKVETETNKTTKEVTKEIVGTKRTEIEGILDRINLLKENMNCRFMFGMKADKNVNFLDAIEQGKTIVIKMPEHIFSNRAVKNVLVTFFTSKILLAAKLRGSMHEKPHRANVYYDEIYQCPTAMSVLCEQLSQLRKFGTKIIISAHHLGQLTREFCDEIKGSGSSYMLFSGCDKKVFDELKDEMKPYELEDMLNLKQFHSLNLIRTQKGYQKLVCKLPNPLY